MKKCAFYQKEKLIADKIEIADTFLTRFFGLMPKKKLEIGEGLFLKNCTSIHCLFMRFPIDVVYLDKKFCILAKETVQPWKLGKFYRGARHVIELKSGEAQELEIGMPIEIRRRER